MTKYQRDVSKDIKYLAKFLEINYATAKNYLKDYKNAKKEGDLKK